MISREKELTLNTRKKSKSYVWYQTIEMVTVKIRYSSLLWTNSITVLSTDYMTYYVCNYGQY